MKLEVKLTVLVEIGILFLFYCEYLFPPNLKQLMVNTLLKIRLHLKSRNKKSRCEFSFQCNFGLLVPLLITFFERLFIFIRALESR